MDEKVPVNNNDTQITINSIELVQHCNEFSGKLAAKGITGIKLSFQLSEDNFKKLNEDLFYRIKTHGEDDTVPESDEIEITLENNFNILITKK